MTAINFSNADAPRESRAYTAWQNMEKNGRPFMFMESSWDSLIGSMCTALVVLLCWRYVLPHLPGVKFDGTIYDALRAAWATCIIGNFWGVLYWETLRRSVKSIALGKPNLLMFVLCKIVKYASIAIQLLAVTVIPFCHLKMENWQAFALAYAVIASLAWGAKKLVLYFVPID